ncbi:hypothetical protein ORV05_31580 [Amycolatopsis cynarae]|uniref:Uncharacterized protein n=1 Tax=Amycolatopsis cynarae TaxID=2995223 RepID=A0ABY7B3B4_9PSEU|nr:hypothetical protein [Amycolatopsis sp. HUAS 11-8]WAL65386.1 hypothetical protein ORV05_31580 [Amycolatopsis sp. HUAS 11-8]
MALVRTMLRSGSGDIVTAIKLADRTGIVAASAPPTSPEPVGSAGPLVSELAPVPVVPERDFDAPGPSATRRLRRNLLFACAAALFLIVGWIGGGTFGHHDGDPAPAVATGAVTGKEPADEPTQVSVPPTATRTLAQPTPTGTPSSDGADNRKETSAPAKRVAHKTSPSGPATTSPSRVDLLDRAAATMPDPMSAVAQQFQQMVGSWVDLANWGYGPVSGYGPEFVYGVEQPRFGHR